MTAEIVRLPRKYFRAKSAQKPERPTSAEVVTLPVVRVDRASAWDSLPSDSAPWFDPRDFA